MFRIEDEHLNNFEIHLHYNHRLQMLKSLDVSFNSILEIPEEIGSAASLVKYVHLVFSHVLILCM